MWRVGSAVAASAVLVAGTVLAQDVLRNNQDSSEMRGSWIIGAGVTSTAGEDVGSIDDILLDEEDGSVTAAILSVGGFLGFGSKNIAVDWNELNLDYDGNEVTIDLTREEAEEAPDFNFREREFPPPPEPATGTGTGGTDTGTGGLQ